MFSYMNTKVNANIVQLPPNSFEITKVVANKSKNNRISPIRKIPKTYRSIRGKSSQQDGSSLHFESKLEYELHVLLKFDLNVDYIVEQPLRIEFLDFIGAERSYTPDLLVHFRKGIEPASYFKPALIEVKYINEVRTDTDRIVMEMNVAEQVCKQNGWEYLLLTDDQIHCQRLKNAKFLINYDRLSYPPGINADRYYHHDKFTDDILNTLKNIDQSTPKLLLNTITTNLDDFSKYLPYLWYLVRWRKIGIDYDEPINMSTKIWNLR